MTILKVHDIVKINSPQNEAHGMYARIKKIPGSDDESQKIIVKISRIYEEIVNEENDGIFYFDKKELLKINSGERLDISKESICRLLFRGKEHKSFSFLDDNPLYFGDTKCMHDKCNNDAFCSIFVMHTNHTIYEVHVCLEHAYYNGMHTEIPCKKVRSS